MNSVDTPTAPELDARRADAMRELTRRRGTLTLGELADAAGRVKAARTADELKEALRAFEGGTDSPAAPRRWHVVFLGGYSQRGRWRLDSGLWLISVLGGAELDLRHAIVTGDKATITCVSVLGGARLIVPEGVPVSSSGLTILGGRGDARAPAALPGAPTIHVRQFSLLGGIEIADAKDEERPSRTVDLGDDAVVVRLTGRVALAALRRELRIPYAAIRDVSAEPAELPPAWAIRIGTAVPFTDVRHGLFRWQGRWHFYSLNDRRHAITLRLDGFTLAGRPIETVVLGVDEPETIKRALEARRATVG